MVGPARPRKLNGALRAARGAVALMGLALLAACASIHPRTIDGVPIASDGGITDIGGSVYGNYLAGREASLVDDAPTAAKYFGRALTEDPDNVEILNRAFLLAVTAGDIDRAKSLSQRMVDRGSAHHVARLVLAVSDIHRRRYGDAVKEIDAASKGSNSDAIWATLKAWALAGEGKTDDGLKLLRGESVRSALGAFGLYHEALLLDLAGRKDAADKAYSAAAKASHGGSERLVEAYGGFLQRTGQRDRAIKLYTKFLAAVPDYPGVVEALDRAKAGRPAPRRLVANAAQGTAEALYGLAAVLANQRAVDLPIVYDQLALYLRPDLTSGLALLGELYERQENWSDAIAAYRSIPERSPLARLAAVSIARNLARMDKDDEAIKLMKKWAAKGDDVDVLVTLGDLHRSEKQWGPAAEAYAKALSIYPKDRPGRWQIIYARAIALERGGEWSKAEPMFRDVLKLEPNQPDVLNYLGYSWIDRGENLKEALKLIKQAVTLRPDDGYIVDSLGWAYYRLGDYKNAVHYLERAVELKPDDSTINDHLGDAYWKVGRKLEARFQWTHAMTFGPSPEDAKIIKRKLAQGLDGTDAGPKTDAGLPKSGS
jgi:tetratricopeptide (TPR) repeat protein